jgi:hypothetical protein
MAMYLVMWTLRSEANIRAGLKRVGFWPIVLKNSTVEAEGDH